MGKCACPPPAPDPFYYREPAPYMASEQTAELYRRQTSMVIAAEIRRSAEIRERESREIRIWPWVGVGIVIALAIAQAVAWVVNAALVPAMRTGGQF